MRGTIKIALVALAFAGAPLMAAHPASAQVAVSVNGGGIAFGYTDGYWDTAHAWHPWGSPAEAAAWRDAHHDHYYEYKHDRDHDQGWRESEHWWEHH
jgi:hypothetical protein